MNDILSLAKSIEKELIDVRRNLHSIAEVGKELDETVEVVWRVLSEIGYEPQKCGRCGLFCDIGKGERVILLRADMDALPIREESGLEFSSENGNMHACGHDIHTAMLIGAAMIFKKLENVLKVRVRLMFQGAEEILFGAKDMIENGVLENPRVDTAFMLHTVLNTGLPIGTVIIPPVGEIAPMADFFEVYIKGKSSHGAEPQNGIDTIRISAQLVTEFYRIGESFGEAVLSIGEIHGGDAPNVISEEIRLSGTLRCFGEEKRKSMWQKINSYTESVKTRTGANINIRITNQCPMLLNDVVFRQTCISSIRNALGDDMVITVDSRGGGSEDFSFISQKLPSVMVAISAGNEKDGCNFPAHNSKTVYSEEVIAYGAATYASIAMLS